MLFFCHLFDFTLSLIVSGLIGCVFGKTSLDRTCYACLYKTRDLQFLLMCHIFLFVFFFFLLFCSLIDAAPVTLGNYGK